MPQLAITIGKYSNDKQPPLPLSNACEKYFAHLIRSRLLFKFFLDLLTKAENLDTLIEKFSGILGNKVVNDESIEAVIRRKCHYSDAFYFHEEFFCELMLCGSVDAYVVYLQDAISEVMNAKPEVLRSQEKVSVNDVLNLGTRDEIIKFIAGKKVNELSNNGLNGLLSFLRDRLGFSFIVEDDPCSGDVITIYEVRNCLVHTGGIVGEVFSRRLPRYSNDLGKKIKIDTTFHDQASECLTSSVRRIDQMLVEKFGIIANHAEVASIFSSISDVLPKSDKFSSKVLSELKERMQNSTEASDCVGPVSEAVQSDEVKR